MKYVIMFPPIEFNHELDLGNKHAIVEALEQAKEMLPYSHSRIKSPFYENTKILKIK